MLKTGLSAGPSQLLHQHSQALPHLSTGASQESIMHVPSTYTFAPQFCFLN